jgi:methylglyoxal reductase
MCLTSMMPSGIVRLVGGDVARVALPTRTLGSCGIIAPALGIGCWAIGGPDVNLGLPMGWDSGADKTAALAGLFTAWECGARLYDTADVYGHGRSERLLGRLVAQVPREEILLVSKVGYFAGTAEHGFHPGHVRRQLEQSLENLGTDRLDIYFLHHSDFGPDDRWLPAIADAMDGFRERGLIRAVGMRGPHRFALERLNSEPAERHDKITRFRAVFERIRPDVLAVRDNLLTPTVRSEEIYTFAARHRVGVLVNKPLAQGLLTGTYDAQHPRRFGPGDHRSRKRWFTSEAVAVVASGLDRLRELVPPGPEQLIRLALWACLEPYEQAIVLVGFTSPAQVRTNLGCLGEPPPKHVLAEARAIMAGVQQRLDAAGEVFLDERTDAVKPAR